MASPQCENGYTKIANELLDAMIRTRLPGQEMRIMLAVIRKTYGFGKKADEISYGQLSKLTDIPRTRVIEHVKSLVSKKGLGSLNNGTRRPPTLWINKDFEKWIPSPKKETSPKEGTTPSPNNGTIDSPNHGTHKRNIKERVKEKIFLSDSEEVRLVQYLFSKILENNSKAKKPNEQVWAKQIDLMLRVDKRTPEDIQSVIDWCQDDEFWKCNILSTAKLREKFDQLYLKMTKGGSHGNKRNDPGHVNFFHQPRVSDAGTTGGNH